jgi:hypothetical protein
LQRARLPSLARIAALETRELTTWAGMLARKRGLLMSQLACLTIPELVTEIAHLQWEMVIETANHAYHYPDKGKRPFEIAKLRTSDSPLDRYAHALIAAWQRMDRERRP